ncbi:hypothetical protein BH18THE2_BH18THE2_09150 [soil metagenome]
MTNVIQNEKQEQEEQAELSTEEMEEAQRQWEIECGESEEKIIQNARIALIQLETEGKKYFKPQDGITYRLTFDRAAAVNVRGQPSEKLKREIKDKKSGEVINEVPVLEWVYEVTHISGNVQTWSITSKKLAAKILNQLINGKSVLDITKRKTGPQSTDVEYDVVGVN